MYTSVKVTAVLLLALATASPVPIAEGFSDGAAIVDIPSSTSYSSLIMANPTNPSPSNPSTNPSPSETYLTPTNVNLPTPSATFAFGDGGGLPSLAEAPSRLGATESGAVKLVGQDTDSSNSTLEDDEAVLRDDTKKQAEAQSNKNSAGGLVVGSGMWMGVVGIVSGFAILGM